MKNHYQTLGLKNCVSMGEVRKAYRSLALKFHPDRGGDQARMVEINEAYEYIMKNKVSYDARFQGIAPMQGFTIIVGGFSQSWEFSGATTSSGGY